ncbi:DUF1116 domain-containing protein [Escherichia coli]
MLRLSNKFVALVHTGWMCNRLLHLSAELDEGRRCFTPGRQCAWRDRRTHERGVVGACRSKAGEDEAQALAILEQGEVNFIPRHHVNAVGPMGGITSASMPMLVVENGPTATGVLQPQRRYRQSDAFWRFTAKMS